MAVCQWQVASTLGPLSVDELYDSNRRAGHRGGELGRT
jgi:hypothetical protein